MALVPLVVFGLLGGAIADAVDRRRLLLITSGGTAVASALLLVQPLLPGPGHLVGAVGADRGRVGARRGQPPTRSAVIPALVGPGRSPAANALNFTVQQAGVIVGPLLGGFLIEAGGLPITYAIDALGFLLAVAPAARAALAAPARLGGGRALAWSRRSAASSRGSRFLRTQPVLLMTFVVDIIAMVFALAAGGVPAARRDDVPALGRTPGLAVGRRLDRLAAHGSGQRLDHPGRPAGRASSWCPSSVWGVAVGAVRALALAVCWAVFWLAVAGAGDLVSAVLRSSMLQTAAPDDMRGRMQGVFTVVVAGGPRLGDLRAGGWRPRRRALRDGVRRGGDRRPHGRLRRGRALVLALPGSHDAVA